MTEVAGEVADGMLCHGFTTASYLQEQTLPALETGAAKAGRTRADLELSIPAFVVTGNTDEERERSATGVRRQVAFYGSTPAYRGVLEHHGWGDLQDDLNRLSKQGEWEQMGELITDEILEEFAVVAPTDELAAKLLERWGGLVDRISFYAPYETDRETWLPVVEALKAG
jgi:probable F420-dependent oxidoreductase